MGLEHIIYPRLQIFHNVTVNIRCLCQRKQDDCRKNSYVTTDIVWNNRNNYVWNDSRANASQVGKQAKQLWKEWKGAKHARHTSSCYHVLQEHQQRHIEQRKQQRITAVQLQPPLQGRLKCNVDDNFYNEGHVNGWGLVYS
jgi:hypothetical protein